MSRCELYRLGGMSAYNPSSFLIRIRAVVNTDAFSSIANAMQRREDMFVTPAGVPRCAGGKSPEVLGWPA